jgi:hypothetical protein
VKNMKFKLALGIAALALSLSPARATTYDYAVDFAIGVHAVTGSIQTDCNNCVLSSSDLSSYQFFLDGANGFSSSDPFISLSIVGSSLVATPTDVVFEVGSPSSEFQLCAGGIAACSSSYVLAIFGALSGSSSVISVNYEYPNSPAGTGSGGVGGFYTTSFDLATYTSATPLPAALPLFGSVLLLTGLVLRARRPKGTAAIAAA